MMFFKSITALSALLVLASGIALEHKAPTAEISIIIGSDAASNTINTPVFSMAKGACDKEDEADCKEFCSLADQTSTCAANGDKVTCYCKGGKSESKCEERCLFCMPDKTAMEEARRIFKIGGQDL